VWRTLNNSPCRNTSSGSSTTSRGGSGTRSAAVKIFPNSPSITATQFEGHGASVDGRWMRSGAFGGDPKLGTTSSAIRLVGEAAYPITHQIAPPTPDTHAASTASREGNRLKRYRLVLPSAPSTYKFPGAVQETRDERQLCWHLGMQTGRAGSIGEVQSPSMDLHLFDLLCRRKPLHTFIGQIVFNAGISSPSL
jgi:hypothetical protein